MWRLRSLPCVLVAESVARLAIDVLLKHFAEFWSQPIKNKVVVEFEPTSIPNANNCHRLLDKVQDSVDASSNVSSSFVLTG